MITEDTNIGCPICKHYQFDGTCTAFPTGIPLMFLSGQEGHTMRIAEQTNDLVFEWISPEAQMNRASLARQARRNQKLLV
jgi:hypothetical protein